MQYNHVSVTLTPGQIKRIQSAIKKSHGISVLLKKDQLTGTNKLALTDRQIKNFNKAKQLGKGIKLELSVAAVKDTAKTGGIFPFLAALPALIAAAVPSVAKAATLGAIGTAAGMALKKATGKGYKKKGKGLRLPGTPYSYGKGLRLPGTVY